MRVDPFSFVAEGHPLQPQLAALAAAVRREPRVAALAARSGPRGLVVHAEAKALPVSAGHWQLDRFYWSLQARGGSSQAGDDSDARRADPAGSAGAAPRFDALTAVWSAQDGVLRWHAFPEDPRLGAVAGYLAQARQAGSRVDVLRYVPLRRLTFIERDVASRVRVGKFKRASRFAQAHRLLQQVAHGAARQTAFRVPQPLGVDPQRQVHFQQALPGEDLAERIDAANCEPLLAQVGALHSRLHRLAVDDVPHEAHDSLLPQARLDAEWIAFMQPAQAGPLADTVALLARHVPAQPAARAFCHGDFVCSQLLVAERDWSVIDFDLCRLGDAHRDAAILLASLPYDVPALATGRTGAAGTGLIERAERAYLDGYRDAGGLALDARRLAWHRLCAELHYLALMLKKDRFEPAAFEQRLGRLGTLGERLRQGA